MYSLIVYHGKDYESLGYNGCIKASKKLFKFIKLHSVVFLNFLVNLKFRSHIQIVPFQKLFQILAFAILIFIFVEKIN